MSQTTGKIIFEPQMSALLDQERATSATMQHHAEVLLAVACEPPSDNCTVYTTIPFQTDFVEIPGLDMNEAHQRMFGH